MGQTCRAWVGPIGQVRPGSICSNLVLCSPCLVCDPGSLISAHTELELLASSNSTDFNLKTYCVGNNSNLVTYKLIPTMRKRTTICIIGVWFIASTTTRGKLKLSSASNSRNIRTNKREMIDIIIVGLSAKIREHRRCRGKKRFSEQSRRRFPKILYASYPVQGHEET